MTATDYHIWWQRYFVVQLADDGTIKKKRVTRRMTTRSGQPYKKESMAAEQFEKMFQFLLEDRKLRDQEFAAERDRLENERRTRERETREQMEAMHAHMEKLVSMMEKTQSTQSGKSVRELSVKLVPFSEKEDIEAYLVTFERIMTAHMVNKDRWPHFLVPQLSGRAQLAFAALPTEQSADYSAIKAAILALTRVHTRHLDLSDTTMMNSN